MTPTLASPATLVRAAAAEAVAITATRALWVPAVVAVLAAPATALLVLQTGSSEVPDLASAATAGLLAPLTLWAIWGAVLSGSEFSRGGVGISVVMAGSTRRLVAAKYSVAIVVSLLASALGEGVALAVTWAAVPGRVGIGSVAGLLAVPVISVSVTVVGVALGLILRSSPAAVVVAVVILVAPKGAGGLLGGAQSSIVGASPATVARVLVAGSDVVADQRFPAGGGAALGVVVLVAVVAVVASTVIFTRSDV